MEIDEQLFVRSFTDAVTTLKHHMQRQPELEAGEVGEQEQPRSRKTNRRGKRRRTNSLSATGSDATTGTVSDAVSEELDSALQASGSGDPYGGDHPSAETAQLFVKWLKPVADRVPRRGWQVGDQAWAPHDDGLLYLAQVTEVDSDRREAGVTFSGWDNSTVTDLRFLRQVDTSFLKNNPNPEAPPGRPPPPSIAAALERCRLTSRLPDNLFKTPAPPPSSSSKHSDKEGDRGKNQEEEQEERGNEPFTRPRPFHMPAGASVPPAPPGLQPLLQALPSEAPGESEVLRTLLVDWYMAGYHAGFFQGVQHASGRNKHSKASRRRQSHTDDSSQ